MKKRTIKIVISLILFVISLSIAFSSIWLNNSIYIISYLIVGLEIVKKAIRNIIRGKVFDENFLMTIATLGAFSIGEFPEAVAVMLFYQIGELFQDYAVDKSRKSISSLMEMKPDFANRKREEKIEKVSPEEVKIGEEIIVKPGEKVPLDGIILDGNSLLDTSALTGEPVPKQVKIGDEILSGTINQTGVLNIKVTKEFGESTVCKILELVENASSKKSKSENFITKFAKYYTPIVVIIALILAVVPPFIFKVGNFTDWLYRALSFLVVSCPCALVISIPLSFFGGIGGASKVGVLVKGSNYLEALAKTDTIVFDKTGTLTKGVFEVQKIEAVERTNEELLEITAKAEYYSNHPISQSLKKAYQKQIDTSQIKQTQEIAGLGIRAIVQEKEVFVGNEKLMLENQIEYKACEEIGTILYVAIDKKFAGTIVISDEIKEDSYQAIKKLKKSNIKEIVMLTGDKEKVAKSVAKTLGIETVYAELLPDGKVRKIEELLKKKNKKQKLAFVGDGMNDSPVLALADVGIAMGGIGAQSSIEAADIVIMTDEPSKIASSIQIAKKTIRIAKENIIFAIAVKVGILLLTAIRIIYYVGGSFCRCWCICNCNCK